MPEWTAPTATWTASVFDPTAHTADLTTPPTDWLDVDPKDDAQGALVVPEDCMYIFYGSHQPSLPSTHSSAVSNLWSFATPATTQMATPTTHSVTPTPPLATPTPATTRLTTPTTYLTTPTTHFTTPTTHLATPTTHLPTPTTHRTTSTTNSTTPIVDVTTSVPDVISRPRKRGAPFKYPILEQMERERARAKPRPQPQPQPERILADANQWLAQLYAETLAKMTDHS